MCGVIFFLNDSATTEIYTYCHTLSRHDALPILGHRRQRERQILRELEKGTAVIPVMVGHMYKDLDPRLTGAAGRSVLAHLIDLEARGDRKSTRLNSSH